MASALVCIDFDQTITRYHMNSFQWQAFHSQKNYEGQLEILAASGINGMVEDWKNFLNYCFENNHLVCIVSFNKHLSGELIQKIEKEIFQLHNLYEHEAKKIRLFNTASNEQYPLNKNDYIERARCQLKFKGTNSEIILIDDDIKNIEAALNKGYLAFQADFDSIGELLKATIRKLEHIKTKPLQTATNNISDNVADDQENTNTIESARKKIDDTCAKKKHFHDFLTQPTKKKHLRTAKQLETDSNSEAVQMKP